MTTLFDDDKQADSLQEEIDMLRAIIRQTYQIVQEIDDPAAKLRGLNAIGLASDPGG